MADEDVEPKREVGTLRAALKNTAQPNTSIVIQTTEGRKNLGNRPNGKTPHGK